MNTEHYIHKIAAIYPDVHSAESALEALRQENLDDVKITHLHAGGIDAQRAVEPEQAATRDRFILDILAGTGAGAAAGAVGAGAIGLALPALFVSVPVVGPLMVAGYGAMIGGTVGAVKGIRVKEGLLASVVQDAIKRDFHVVVVHCADKDTCDRAGALVRDTLPEETATA